MPTIFTHAVAACAVDTVVTGGRRLPARLWLLCAVLAILPDVDVVAFSLGVPYGSMWGHRGIAHSLTTAAVTSAVATALVRRRVPLRASASGSASSPPWHRTARSTC